MSNYYVVTVGYSAVVKGPYPDYDKAVEVAEDHVIRQRVSVIVVKEVGACAAQPTEVKWTGLQ